MFFILKEVVCTWFVHDVHFHGVGCVKQNGLENVWAATGSVKKTLKLTLFFLDYLVENLNTFVGIIYFNLNTKFILI